MACMVLVNSMELLGRASPEKTVNPEKPKIQSNNEFPDLQDAENQYLNPQKKWQGNKRKKSEGSPPPGTQPNKKKGNKLPKPIEAAASILDGAQTQPEKEVEGSGAVGSKEPVGLTTKTRRKTIGPHTGVKTRRQKKKENEEIGMEEEKDLIAANSRLPNYEDGEPENRPAQGRLPLNLGEYLQNPTYSGNFNQITEPCQRELTKDDKVRNSDFFWKMYKDKIYQIHQITLKHLWTAWVEFKMFKIQN